MDTIWTNAKWSFEELERKTVEFRLPISNGIFHGIGEFWVRRNRDGLLAIEVVTDEPGRHWQERVQKHFPLAQGAVDRIESHPDSSLAAFRLV